MAVALSFSGDWLLWWALCSDLMFYSVKHDIFVMLMALLYYSSLKVLVFGYSKF